MLKVIIILILWTSSILSCNGQNVKRKAKINDEEKEIICSLIIHIESLLQPINNIERINDVPDHVRDLAREMQKDIDKNKENYFLVLCDSLVQLDDHARSFIDSAKYYGLGREFSMHEFPEKYINIRELRACSALKLYAGEMPGNKEVSEGFMGKLTISHIVFNSDTTNALLYVTRIIDFNNGSGSFVLLEKEKGHWRIVKEDSIWII